MLPQELDWDNQLLGYSANSDEDLDFGEELRQRGRQDRVASYNAETNMYDRLVHND